MSWHRVGPTRARSGRTRAVAIAALARRRPFPPTKPARALSHKVGPLEADADYLGRYSSKHVTLNWSAGCAGVGRKKSGCKEIRLHCVPAFNAAPRLNTPLPTGGRSWKFSATIRVRSTKPGFKPFLPARRRLEKQMEAAGEYTFACPVPEERVPSGDRRPHRPGSAPAGPLFVGTDVPHAIYNH